LAKIGAEKCHLVTHSFTGIDARAAVSMFEANKNVSTLTTICTPHHGMSLIDKIQSQGHQNISNLDRVFENLGLTNKAA